jgi:hypothetical protein
MSTVSTAEWKTNSIGHIMHRNCLLQQVIEGKIKGGIEVTGRQRRCRKLLDDLKERRGYYHLKVDWFCGRVAPTHLGLMLQALCALLLVPSINSRGAPCHAGDRVLY